MCISMNIVLAIAMGLFAVPGFGQLIQPSDLEYRGAFRVPEEDNGNNTWAYGGSALAYYPGGNPTGPNDGYPGSLFGTGHVYALHVSEISIPTPVISVAKDPDQLNIASTLQPFASITGGVTPAGDQCLVAGLEYLPAQGNQTSGKLYYVQGHHWMEFDDALGNCDQPTLWWADLTLSNPHPAGIWRLGTTNSYNTCGYIMEIPSSWASLSVQGYKLGIGNHREGRSGSQGPTLYACGPWLSGNPPAPNTSIPAVELLHYGDVGSVDTFNNYRHSDVWGGAAWIESNGKSGVVLTGSKGLGREYYDVNCQGKGWYCDSYACELIFYNPVEFAQVAAGTRPSYQMQTYATLNVESLMFGGECRARIDGTAYDRANNLLYVAEMTAIQYGYPIIHVWKVNASSAVAQKKEAAADKPELFSSPNPFTGTMVVTLTKYSRKDVTAEMYDVSGRKVRTLVPSIHQGAIAFTWDGRNNHAKFCPQGIYCVKVCVGGRVLSKQVLFIR